MVTRKYKFKDLYMLLAAQTILENLEEQLPVLSKQQANWDKAFVEQEQQQVSIALKDYLGIDTRTDLRKASKVLLEFQAQALRDLAFLRTQIDLDFHDDDKEQLLDALGFNEFLKPALRKDSEALVDLLYTFKQHLDPRLRQAITDNGTSPTLLDAIIGYSLRLENAHIGTETFRSGIKGNVTDAIVFFNNIYTSVADICKTASKHYKEDNLLKAKFTFAKTIKTLRL